MGTGTLSDALDWVEYCNSTAKSLWAARRRRNGRDEPYGVVYWGLGNEMYGDWQNLTVNRATKTCRRGPAR